jgi:ABC-type branched-subunit amino acid transport system substrate-binding protein
MLNKYCSLLICLIASVSSFAQIEIKRELTPDNSNTRFQKRGNASLKEAIERSGSMSANNYFQQNPVVKKHYVVSLLLPFSGVSTANKIDAFISARETGAKPQLIPEEAKTALDFYDGVLFALKEMQDSLLEIELHVFDTWNNDSITKELLKQKTIQYSNIIIGPVTNSTSKLIADFCKQRKIVNVQPFSPSKSLTTDNPYHIKIAPTMDAHIDNMARSLADSFLKENIIVYCTNQESSLQSAKRLDSLLKNFDGVGKTRFTSTLFNFSNPIVKGEKKTLNDLLSATKRNVVVVCVFDESNAQMVVKQLAEKKSNIVVYGMPTWLNSEILRLDYLNKLSARFTEQYVFDTTTDRTLNFYYTFYHEYGIYPARYAWLGYDVTKWLEKSLKAEGEFPLNIAGTFYSGVGNKFQFRAVTSGKPDEKPRIDYFENSYLHLVRLENYVLMKEW